MFASVIEYFLGLGMLAQALVAIALLLLAPFLLVLIGFLLEFILLYPGYARERHREKKLYGYVQPNSYLQHAYWAPFASMVWKAKNETIPNLRKV